MEEWKSIRLGDIVRIGSGLAYKADHLGSGDALLLGMGCVSFNEKFLKKGARLYSGISEERYIVSPGDIVLATRQQSDNLPILGMPAIIPEDYQGKRLIAGSNLYIVHNQSDIDNRFLYWLLKTPGYINHISSCKTGTTVRMITKKDVESFVFKCPPKEERERIADFLWSIEDKIDLNNRINHNLEEQARIHFDAWCSKCMDSKPIRALSSNILDYTPNNHKKVILLNSSDVTEGRFESLPYVDNHNLKGQFKKRFKKGDILYSEIRPRNHHYAICYFDAEDYIASTRLMVIRKNSEMIPSDALLYQYLLMPSVMEEFTSKTESRSGTFPQGNYEDLSTSEVPYSKDNSQISNTLEAIYGIIWNNLEENKRLMSLRDSLLPQLMTGQITC